MKKQEVDWKQCESKYFTRFSLYKLRSQISEITRAQRKGNFYKSRRPDPSYRAFGYCTRKQDGRYWGPRLSQMKRDITVRPTKVTPPVKVDTLQSRIQIFR